MGDGKAMAASRDEAKRTSVNPERWQQVKRLLAAALESEPSQRSAFLDRACANDISLREEIENLLAVEQESDPGLLNSPAIDLSAGPASGHIGRRIGSYQIVEEIGEGGMGEVYRAFRADDQYRKQVAIKLVRAGYGSRFVIARFKNERQVLASLDHPNIARLLDGGTTEGGAPYFVMELIEGQPIDKYCDVNKLTTAERLRLFLQVCSAVQYAHQRLIIHRDLKPNNILVTAEGIPKLLDFGIAKVLDTTAAYQLPDPTLSMFRLLTPRYASPEQVRGEAITTASDVYSLGVLLYELLTGHWLYQISTPTASEIERAVCEFEPERPSAAVWRTQNSEAGNVLSQVTPASASAVRDGSPEKLTRNLRGDLDNIVMMALRKEPSRRYASAEQLATDIQRHLENLPVAASRDTFRYRTSKFVKRHKGAVTAVITIGITFICGFAATLYEARLARRQQVRAEQRFSDVRELANSLMFDVHDSIQDLPGSTRARKLLASRALRYLDQLSQDAAADPSLQRELATAYEKVGTVQGNPFGANLGDTQGALESYRKALSIRELRSRTEPIRVEDLVSLARTQRLFAATFANSVQGHASGEEDNMERELHALATAERALQIAPSNPDVLQELQTNYDLLVTLRHYTGDYWGAWTYLQKELPIAEARLQAAPQDRAAQFALGKSEVKSGEELSKLGFRKEALEHSRRAIQIFESMSASGQDANSRRHLAWAQDRLGDVLLMDGDAKGALASYRKEVKTLNPLLASDPNNAAVQLDLGSAVAKVGHALSLQGNSGAGLAALDRATNMFLAQIKRDPAYTEPQWYLAWSRIWTAEALCNAGNENLAAAYYHKVLASWEPNQSPFIQTIVAGVYVNLGTLFAKTGKQDEAYQRYQHALAIVDQIAAREPYILDASYVAADAYSGLGDLSEPGSTRGSSSRQQSQSWADARSWYQRSLGAWERIQNPGARTPAGLQCGNSKRVAREMAKCDLRLKETKPQQKASKQHGLPSNVLALP